MKRDYVGQRFGMWLVLAEAENGGRQRRVLCRCECGTERPVFLTSLLYGAMSRSCGCGSSEWRRGKNINKTHGLTQAPLYRLWVAIKVRCYNPDYRDYARYGGRGITMCDSWLNDPEAFIRDMGPKPSPAHSIERKDVNGPYSPENCTWATATEQARNRRYNATVTLHGVTRTVAEWATITGIGAPKLYWRLHRGLPPAEILAVEDRRLRRRVQVAHS